MSSPRIERKLAAIMFTDIAGYTAQMSKDEAVAISLLNKKESVLKPLIAKHNGTYVKSTGDGSLSHFNSAVDAAMCAKRFQESIYEDKDLNVRVGVHLGDTIFEKGDIRGDGVNIASRLESMAVTGGVFVSKEVHDQLSNQKEFEGVSLGLQSMKGVGRLIEVYGLKGDLLTEPKPSDYQEDKVTVHSDDEVPSIAIIPFRNKGKEEDAFYSYGICADLISDCSSAGLIRVESLERTEKIENYDKFDITELATKLLVRYIATGSLWKMDDIFQLSIELYDTKTSQVLWSDRWEENWRNLPTIKGILSDGLLKALDTKPKVEKKADTTHIEAYEYYLRGNYKFEKRKNIEDMEIARGLLQKAVELDDNLLVAKNLIGWTYCETGDFDKAMEYYIPTLKQAEKMGDKFAINLANRKIGIIYLFKGDYDKSLDYTIRSSRVCKEIGDKIGMVACLHNIGSDFLTLGNNKKAEGYYAQSLNIAEQIDYKHGIALNYNSIGMLNYIKGLYKDAEECLKKSLIMQMQYSFGGFLWTTTFLFLTYKKLGKEFDVGKINSLINTAEKIVFQLNYSLYQLLEDNSYLETAYNQVQETEDNLEPDVAAKFLSYPIPKAIVEEWEKVNK